MGLTVGACRPASLAFAVYFRHLLSMPSPSPYRCLLRAPCLHWHSDWFAGRANNGSGYSKQRLRCALAHAATMPFFVLYLVSLICCYIPVSNYSSLLGLHNTAGGRARARHPLSCAPRAHVDRRGACYAWDMPAVSTATDRQTRHGFILAGVGRQHALLQLPHRQATCAARVGPCSLCMLPWDGSERTPFQACYCASAPLQHCTKFYPTYCPPTLYYYPNSLLVTIAPTVI